MMETTARLRWVPGRRLVARALQAFETRFPSWTPLLWRGYSQQGEDQMLVELLDGHAPAFYVDIGSHHPLRFSTTYLLYRRGWRGVAVDGDSQWARPWRRHRPRDRFVSAVVDVRPGTRSFFLQGDQSTLQPTWAREGSRSIQVETRTLNDVLATHAEGVPIGLLKIDTEGTDMDLLESLDLTQWRPCAILVETHHWTTQDAIGDPRIARWCRKAGYEVIGHNRRNLLLADSAWLRQQFEASARTYRTLNPALYGRAT